MCLEENHGCFHESQMNKQEQEEEVDNCVECY